MHRPCKINILMKTLKHNFQNIIRNMVLTIALLGLPFLSNAQENGQKRVFQQIYDKANKIANDSREDFNNRKIATFSVDAITYLSNKTFGILTDTTRELTNEEVAHINNQLDSMAYFMYNYVNLFTKEYSRARKDAQKKRIIKKFRESSMNHPLFNDPDRQYVFSYCNNDEFITQFSLDTDWVAAMADVKKRLAQ